MAGIPKNLEFTPPLRRISGEAVACMIEGLPQYQYADKSFDPRSIADPRTAVFLKLSEAIAEEPNIIHEDGLCFNLVGARRE